MNIAVEIRCPGSRGHSIKGNELEIKYQTCGSLLGGLYDDNRAIYRCPICKRFWEAYFEDGTLVMYGINKGTRLDFEKQIRRVYDTDKE